jgi:hypothetical protein
LLLLVVILLNGPLSGSLFLCHGLLPKPLLLRFIFYKVGHKLTGRSVFIAGQSYFRQAD